jgi:hypothetical protein
MPWGLVASSLSGITGLAGPVSPVDSAAGSVVGYVLGYGPLGIIALALAWLLFKGWRLAGPNRDAELRESLREDLRSDLLRENQRLLEEKNRAEEQRDEALKVARDQVVPILTTFNATMAALLPLLQELVRNRENRTRRQP